MLSCISRGAWKLKDGSFGLYVHSPDTPNRDIFVVVRELQGDDVRTGNLAECTTQRKGERRRSFAWLKEKPRN